LLAHSQTAKLIDDVILNEDEGCLYVNFVNGNNLDNGRFNSYMVHDLVDCTSSKWIDGSHFNENYDYRGRSFCLYLEGWIGEWNQNSQLYIYASYITLDGSRLHEYYFYCPPGGTCCEDTCDFDTSTGTVSCEDCAGVINGGATIDQCGVCGGDGSSCDNPELGFTLLRENVECDDNDKESSIGTYDSVELCAQACRQRDGCTNFIYGKGDKAGKCYDEGVTEEECTEWGADEYNFYKLNSILSAADTLCSPETNMGTFTTAEECNNSAQMAGCASKKFMFSSDYPSWGCRCCADGDDVEYHSHSNWDLYQSLLDFTTSSPTTLPTPSPTTHPTETPSADPSKQPSSSPTSQPSMAPTALPSVGPSKQPSTSPTSMPSSSPTYEPSLSPTSSPTPNPTKQPSKSPSQQPTSSPTCEPSTSPTSLPTTNPTKQPSKSPSQQPTPSPTDSPSISPTSDPTSNPTTVPTPAPTDEPSKSPTELPSKSPSKQPTPSPTQSPSTSPTTNPTMNPTTDPTTTPTDEPSENPSQSPSMSPTISVETRLSQLEEMMSHVNRQLSDLMERMEGAESNVDHIDDGLTTISTCVASYEPIDKEDDDDATKHCATITNPCECVGDCGWSTENDLCGSGAEYRTTCTECDTLEGCITGSCLTLSDHICPSDYNEMRICQCNDQCRDFGNCCWDVTGCGGDNYERLGSDFKCDVGDSRTFRLDFTSVQNCAQRCLADDNCDHFATDLHQFCIGCAGLPLDEGIGFHVYKILTFRRRLSLEEEVAEMRKLNKKLIKMNQELREELMRG